MSFGWIPFRGIRFSGQTQLFGHSPFSSISFNINTQTHQHKNTQTQEHINTKTHQYITKNKARTTWGAFWNCWATRH